MAVQQDEGHRRCCGVGTDSGQLVGEEVQNSNHHFTQSYRKYYNPIKCISITN